MKWFVSIFLGCTSAMSACQVVAAPATAQKWVVIETSHYVWRANGAPYTFLIEEYLGNLESGYETSPRLKIVGPGGKATVIAAEPGFTTIDNTDLSKLTHDNLVHSHYLYLTRKLTGAATEPALIVFGGPISSDPGGIRIVMLDKGGAPRVVLAEDSFDLIEIIDLDHDGVPEVVGQRSSSQLFNDCVKTYDPVSVFKFTPVRDRLVYSEALSRHYMKAHGLEWAGPKMREDIGVSLCVLNKGKIVILSKP